jgi:hypothetical protein
MVLRAVELHVELDRLGDPVDRQVAFELVLVLTERPRAR